MEDIKYPKHFYEPIRIKIITEQFQHEFRKLFPSVKQENWKKLDKDIYNWFDGKNSELASVSDFWNASEGVLYGFKLKGLFRWVSAENILWTEERVKVKDIILTWSNPQLSFMGEAPYLAKDIIKELDALMNRDIKEKIKIDSDQRVAAFVPRDFHKVILFDNKKKGVLIGEPAYNSLKGYQALEGNRRVLRAIIYNKPFISAYVGKYKDNSTQPRNYWVSTFFLRNLLFLADKFLLDGDKKAFNSVKYVYKNILKESKGAIIVSDLRVFNKSKAGRIFRNYFKNFIKELR